MAKQMAKKMRLVELFKKKAMELIKKRIKMVLIQRRRRSLCPLGIVMMLTEV